jgi:hypothetical protein
MSRHDFRACDCPAYTFSDGGGAYLRVGGSPELDENGNIVLIIKWSDVPQKESAW